MPTKKPRISITLEPDLYEKIIDLRFTDRYSTISDAVVYLIELGYETNEKLKKENQSLNENT